MGTSAAAGDARLCLSELATNAVLHSRSGRPGGHFSVTIQHSAGCWRVSVTDEGGPWLAGQQPDPGGLHNRGLNVVGLLASQWHIDGDGVTGRTVWFEIAG